MSNKRKCAPPFTSARGQDDLLLSNSAQEVSSSYGQEDEDERSYRELAKILLEDEDDQGVPLLDGKQSPDGRSSSALETSFKVHGVLSTRTKFWCFGFSYEAALP